MKKIVEMHFCDVCGCEVNTENRYMIRLAALTNWDYDAEIDAAFEKDLCPDCYNTMLQLIKETKTDKQPAMLIEKPKSTRGKIRDINELEKMWACGYTQKEIANRLGVTAGAISKHICRWSEEHKDAILEKYIGKTNHVVEETKQMKVITDEYGLVQSIEES